MCVRAQSPPGLEMGAVCVERGVKHGPKKNVESHTQTHTYIQKNSKQGTLPSHPSRYEEAFFLGKPRKKRLASLARLIFNTVTIAIKSGGRQMLVRPQST